MPTIQQQRDKLIGLLKELFQLDQPDLDFGFYRIMHAKAREVTAFLENDLLKTVEEKFSQSNAASIAHLQKAYDDAVAQAKSFGAADPEQTEPVKQAKAALAAAKDTARAETEVYDHLYRFFERYYDAGDFMSLRYLSRETSSKAAAYAVPYDGSEVCLHWANKDQYYIKTTEYFTDFTFDPAQASEVRQAEGLFTAPNQPLHVHFLIVAATEGEHGNIKAGNGAKRYFILHKDDPISIENGDLIVRFEYRPDPDKTGQDQTWQARRSEEAVAGILEALGGLNDARAKEYLAILKTPAPTEKRADRPLLAKYIGQYTARNTMDYFIHKDLGGFLRRELDFYIKNEVMRLDDIEAADVPKAEQYLAQVKVLRQIAGKLIDFLAQLENFQKRLWLKKKFVVEMNYCVTLDRVPEELYPEIAANDAQREEWVRLFAIDEITAENLGQVAYSVPLTVKFLKANHHLVLDTKCFDQKFKDELLTSINDIDANDHGLLVHAENFQALQFVQQRYYQGISACYVDPPYNTDATEIVYKNGYKDASWCSLMQDRLFLAKRLLHPEAITCTTIDDCEVSNLAMVLGELMAEYDLRTVIIEYNHRGRVKSNFAITHEYALWAIPRGKDLITRERETSEDIRRNLRRTGTDSTRGASPKQFYGIEVDRETLEVVGVTEPLSVNEPIPDHHNPRTEMVWPIDEQKIERRWYYGSERVLREAQEGTVWAKRIRGEIQIHYHQSGKPKLRKSIWVGKVLDASTYGSELLNDLFGMGRVPFSFPKSIHAVGKCIESMTYAANALLLDYFAGSGTTGHAVINLNREDEGNRKYILVEMGDYFDTVLKPRIQKVVYSTDWKDGKPVSRDSGMSHMFKYIRLESYEDCLNNLELTGDAERDRIVAGSAGLREDYMLHYMLDVETKGSASLLNIDRFADPTAYKLKVKKPGSDEYEWKNVDLLETFNYLIGLRVEHIAAPQAFRAQFDREKDPDLPKGQLGRLVVKGRLKQDPKGPWWFRKVEGWVPKNPQTPNDGRREKVLIVWRKLTGDIEQDNLVLDEWFRKYQINPRESYDYDTIYVNGSNNLPNLKLENENWRVRLIEEDFHRLMWDVEDV